MKFGRRGKETAVYADLHNAPMTPTAEAEHRSGLTSVTPIYGARWTRTPSAWRGSEGGQITEAQFCPRLNGSTHYADASLRRPTRRALGDTETPLRPRPKRVSGRLWSARLGEKNSTNKSTLAESAS